MNTIQQLQFSMLKKLDEVCKKHNLLYYIAYGTCIGAMRYKGFIPWDHDIDVLMPIDHVLRLLKYQDEFGENYFFSTYLNDKNNTSIRAVILDKKHKCRMIEKGKIKCIINVCIDVYPFYDCPPTKICLLLNIWRAHIYKVLVGGIPQNHGIIAKAIGKIILLITPHTIRAKIIRRIERKLNYKGISYEIADYFGLDIKFMSAITYKKEWFSKPSELEFEGQKFFAPTDPDKYLTKRYGDYKTPLSETERESEVKLELITEETV